MLTRDDLVDLIMEHLKPAPSGAPAAAEKAAAPAPRGRIFLSEHEIKRRLSPDAKELMIAPDAILSPLAQDWLVLRGIKIIRHG